MPLWRLNGLISMAFSEECLKIMRISIIALNRMVEEQSKASETYRQKVALSGRPLLSDGRSMLDDDLLSKLHSFGFAIDRSCLLEMIPRFASGQDMSEALIRDQEIDLPGTQEDWVWIAVTCLWERWCPCIPNMEMVDDKMQAGYSKLNAGNRHAACQLWTEAWHDILKIISRHEIPSLDAFNEQFAGTQCLFNWVQDFESELGDAGIDEVHFFHERISLCKTMIDRFSTGTFSEIDFKTALAQSHFKIGEHDKCDLIFQQCLDKNPQWGWGWIGWSDVYFSLATPENQDATKAEMILKRGLAVADVSDRRSILERLTELYDETDRPDNAADIRRQMEQQQKRKSKALVASPGKLQNGNYKAGRNDSCPCGSGKKFKKCCISRGGVNGNH